MANVDPRVKRLIIQRAKKYGVDPAAALAVAQGEGGIRWGAVGDNQTSFGPFQLRIGGANPHKDPKRAKAFANSPAGIDYALRKMSESGAKGLRGAAAVDAIVRKFERPADPDSSVRNAIGRLGKLPATATGTMVASTVPVAAGAPIPKQAFGTLNDLFKKVGLKPLDIVGDLPLPTKSVPGLPPPPSPGAPALPTPVPKGTKLPRLNLMVTAIEKAQQMGLTVRENAYVDPVGAGHVKGSDHYKTVGKQKGRKVGGAIDVSGDPKTLMAYFRWAEQYAGRGLNDLFHDPAGYSYDRGKRWDKTIGGHQHVHFSV